MDNNLKAMGWILTFSRFALLYNRPVRQNPDDFTFAVLNDPRGHRVNFIWIKKMPQYFALYVPYPQRLKFEKLILVGTKTISQHPAFLCPRRGESYVFPSFREIGV